MEGKVIRCGNSSVIVINSRFMRKLGLQRGDRVELSYNEESGTILVTFPGVRQLSLTSRRI